MTKHIIFIILSLALTVPFKAVSQDKIFDAVANGKTEKVKNLINQGSPVDARDMDSLTPLMHACLNNNPQMVCLLIDKGADVNTVDIDASPVITVDENLSPNSPTDQ